MENKIEKNKHKLVCTYHDVIYTSAILLIFVSYIYEYCEWKNAIYK